MRRSSSRSRRSSYCSGINVSRLVALTVLSTLIVLGGLPVSSMAHATRSAEASRDTHELTSGIAGWFGFGQDGSDEEPVPTVDPDSLVAGFRSCVDQWPLYVGEVHTIVPNPVDFAGEPVACADVLFRSDNPAVATVTSWGEVEAFRPGVANVTVQSGAASTTVSFTVREGIRQVVTDDEWDLQHPTRCAVATEDAGKLSFIDAGDDPDSPDAAIPGNETGSPNLRAMEYAGQSSIGAKTNFGSSNYSFAAPVLALGGREVGVGLSLIYNGQPWQKDVIGSTTKMTFNYGKSLPAAGWRLGFGRIIEHYDGPSSNNVLLIQPDGTKIVLKYDSATTKCLSEDGTFLEYGPMTGKLKYPDGTIVQFSLVFANKRLPVSIQSRNGNIVTISYKPAGVHPKGSIDVITDTLGRTVTFHYYGDALSGGYQPPAGDANNPTGALYSVRVEDRGFVPGGTSNKRELIRLSYANLPVFPSNLFAAGITVDAPATSVTAVAGIYYPATGTGYTFDYASSYGMATTIHVRKDMTSPMNGVDVARTTYAFPTTGQSLNNLPRFSSRTEWRDDGNGGNVTSTWNYANNNGGGSAPSTYTVTASSASPDVIVTRTTVGFAGGSNGKTNTTEVFKTSVMGQLMRKVDTTYIDAPDDAASIWSASNGGQVIDTVIATNESGEKTKADYDYAGGSFGQVMKVDEFDDFSGGGFTKRRTSAFTYFNTWSTTNYKQNLFYLVLQVTVTDPIPSPVIKSKTVFAYDVYSGNLKTYGTSPPMATRDSTYDAAGYQYRGNLTSVTRYINAAASTGPITKNSYFDIFGNVERADVNCCSQKTFAYQGLSNGTGLWFSVPTSVTDGPTGGLNLTRSATYDFANGNVLTATDERGHVVTMTHDSAWRTKTITIPSVDNITARNVVRTMNYDVGSAGKDQLVQNEVLSYWDNGVQRTITNQVWMDGQGRIVRRGVSPASSGSFDAVRMTYDAIGRMTEQTNPYAGNSSGNPTGSTYSTTYVYDVLARATTVTLPDGDTLSTAFAGKTTTVTDQVGRQRRTVVDGLGRTVTVYEQNPGTGALDWTTTNSHDVFDNVTDVKMYLSGGSGVYQQRTASYDGLSRLISRTTPEVNNQTGGTAGTPVTETFTYTDFDAVDVHTDGRGATVDYGFDALNRLTSIASAPAAGDPDTHDVAIAYETVNATRKGLVTSVTDYTDGVTLYGETFVYEANNLGRLQSRTRTIGLASQTGGRRAYQVSYTYNSIGQELTMTYPSNFAVKMDRDSRGRLSAVLNNSSMAKFLSGASYNAAGLVEGLTINDNGASVKLTEDYNYDPERLQLTNQAVTKSSSGAVLMNFNYSYAADAGESGVGTSAGNSGQLMAIANGSTVNGLGAAQRFTYDTVARLETSSGSTPGVSNKGTDTIGTFVDASSTFFLRNSNSPGGADVTFGFGAPAAMWLPIRGDWDGDGADSIGLYDPVTSNFYLKNTNAAGGADIVFSFGVGNLGYLPIAGDWDGDGIDTVGLYLPSSGVFQLRNSNSAGGADLTFSFGVGGPSMRAIGGDWNNDGIDTIGVCDTSNGNFFLKNSNVAGGADLTFTFGAGGATPLAGDWDGSSGDSIGLYVASTSTFLLRNSNSNGAADVTVGYGAANSLPVVGDWDGVTGPGGVPQSDSRRFVYDRFGNRTAMYNSTSALLPAAQTIALQPLSGQSGVVTNRINQVTSTGVGTVTYSHDRAGNVRNDGVTSFTYDVFNRITQSTTGATTTTFQYDAGNRRIQKKVGTSAAVDYIWEGGHILAEYDRATGTFTDYVWAGAGMAATVRGTSTTFLFQDRLSTRLSTDANGGAIGTQNHFPFGEDAGSSGTAEKHRFTTYERDSESGTDYAVNRQSGLGIGRFMRPDPVAGSVESPQSLNRYAYTINDPVNFVDPVGLLRQPPPPYLPWFPSPIPGIPVDSSGSGGAGPREGSSTTPSSTQTDLKCRDVVTVPSSDTDAGLVARVLLGEATHRPTFSDRYSTFFGAPYVSLNEAFANERRAMAAALYNRARLGQEGDRYSFGGVNTVRGAVFQRGQIAGFGGGSVPQSVESALNGALNSAADSDECLSLLEAVYTANEFAAGNGVDPFASFGGTYGWRTLGSSSPGGRLAPLDSTSPSSLVFGSGNQFYTLGP